MARLTTAEKLVHAVLEALDLDSGPEQVHSVASWVDGTVEEILGERKNRGAALPSRMDRPEEGAPPSEHRRYLRACQDAEASLLDLLADVRAELRWAGGQPEGTRVSWAVM